jgi:hypothetical protein
VTLATVASGRFEDRHLPAQSGIRESRLAKNHRRHTVLLYKSPTSQNRGFGLPCRFVHYLACPLVLFRISELLISLQPLAIRSDSPASSIVPWLCFHPSIARSPQRRRRLKERQ